MRIYDGNVSGAYPRTKLFLQSSIATSAKLDYETGCRTHPRQTFSLSKLVAASYAGKNSAMVALSASRYRALLHVSNALAERRVIIDSLKTASGILAGSLSRRAPRIERTILQNKMRKLRSVVPNIPSRIWRQFARPLSLKIEGRFIGHGKGMRLQ